MVKEIKRKNREKVANLLEETWNPTEFCEFFMEHNESKLSEIVSEALREEGYPITANYINTDFNLLCKNTKSFSEWGEIAVEVYISDDEAVKEDDAIRDFFNRGEDMFMYMGNLESIDFEVKFKLTPAEYMELNPTIEEISKELEKAWEGTLISQRMRESNYDPYIEAIRTSVKESGFPNWQTIDLETLTYSTVIENKLDYQSWAEIALERYVYGSLTRFIQTEMFYMYLDHPQHLNIVIEIETTFEEWQEEYGE